MTKFVLQNERPGNFWSLPIDELLKQLKTNEALGLPEEEAVQRKKATTLSRPRAPFIKDMILLSRQFKNPLVLILLSAILLASFLGEYTNTFIILSIIMLSGFLGFWQERNATHALQRLQAMVQVKTTVIRDGIMKDIVSSDVVPGDLVMLNAGDIIPGDAVLVAANDLHVNEAALTGESFPAEKEPCVMTVETPLGKRKNTVYQGTSVVNGTAKVLVIATGSRTEFGKIASSLERNYPETAFEKGTRQFGNMIMTITLILSVLILMLNIYFGKPVTESILFGIALAVGMTPELLPAIITITLSAGAQRLARKKVIVKRLSSIQNLGAVNVFCSDKTGTLTEGTVKVQFTVDGRRNDWVKIRTYAFLNATFETGFTNPMDEAIRSLSDVSIAGYDKLDEVPYDFIRKRLSIVFVYQDKHLLITKGALNNILEICDNAAFADGSSCPLDKTKWEIVRSHEQYSSSGFRTIGICYKDITGDPVISKEDENQMTFLGLIVLSDPLKPDIARTVEKLKNAGIMLKLITGDNQLVAKYVGSQIGLRSDNILTGGNLSKMANDALVIQSKETDIFAETEPHQKERIVSALQKAGNVVGYIGDGINDATALKTADVGISVDTAVDIAKETADIIFLERDLTVLHDGITEGRMTFVNTMKYIFITTSANFGNMFSVAGASLILPFLPLLPKQILLLNLLTDLPAMAIASDSVDQEATYRPLKWNATLIRNFMIVFGIESSVFDFATFGILLYYFQADMSSFQTGWFLESAITEIMILMIIRTQRPVLKSKPGKYLILATLLVGMLTITIPYLPHADLLGFSALPWTIIAGMCGITALYTIIAETTKRLFFKKINSNVQRHA